MSLVVSVSGLRKPRAQFLLNETNVIPSRNLHFVLSLGFRECGVFEKKKLSTDKEIRPPYWSRRDCRNATCCVVNCDRTYGRGRLSVAPLRRENNVKGATRLFENVSLKMNAKATFARTNDAVFTYF